MAGWERWPAGCSMRETLGNAWMGLLRQGGPLAGPESGCGRGPDGYASGTGNLGETVDTMEKASGGWVRRRMQGKDRAMSRMSVMGTRRKWLGILVMLVGLLCVTAGLAQGWRGGGVFIRPGIVVPFGPYWGAYPAYPPVVVAPPPVYAQPSPPVAAAPPQYWYYCDSAKAYYPYVAQCPGGWRAVPPTPP
jgi:hypothetical protein